MNMNWNFIDKGRSLLVIGVMVSALLAGCGGGSGGSASGSGNTSAIVTVVSGSSTTNTARFGKINSLTTGGSNLFMMDTITNPTISRIVLDTGVVSTLNILDSTGNTVHFVHPGVMITAGTNLYVAGTNSIAKVEIATGKVTNFAGVNDTAGHTDGAGSAALFGVIKGLTTDGTNLYVSDQYLNGTGLYVSNNYTNNYIRKVVIATGEVTTISQNYGRTVMYGQITTDGMNIYMAETTPNWISKINIATGVYTIYAGSTTGVSGSSDGTGTAARFYGPEALTTDGNYLYVTEIGNVKIRRIVIATGMVTTLAGTGIQGQLKDGTGTQAAFGLPNVIAMAGTNLYVGDDILLRTVDTTTAVVTTSGGSYTPPGATTNCQFCGLGLGGSTTYQTVYSGMYGQMNQGNQYTSTQMDTYSSTYAHAIIAGSSQTAAANAASAAMNGTGGTTGTGGTGSAAACSSLAYTPMSGSYDPQVDSYCQIAQVDACMYTATKNASYLTDKSNQCSTLKGLLQSVGSTANCRYCP